MVKFHRAATFLASLLLTRKTVVSLSASAGSSNTVVELSSKVSAKSVVTSPIQGMKPGTSGLRKKVEVWQEGTYVENFIQSLVDVAIASNNNEVPHTLIVAGDGRYYNNEAMQKIIRVLAGNGVQNIWIPQDGIMSTPAVSAAIRRCERWKGSRWNSAYS